MRKDFEVRATVQLPLTVYAESAKEAEQMTYDYLMDLGHRVPTPEFEAVLKIGGQKARAKAIDEFSGQCFLIDTVDVCEIEDLTVEDDPMDGP